jgi:F0F1-type ATP synthase membrane subunit c/vacuolar-type H+-ATPase subunit K
MNKSFYFWGVALLGAAFIVGGLVMAYLGYEARQTVVQSLLDENLTVSDPQVLLTYEGARAPEGVEVPQVVIDDAAEARAQALVIREHTLTRTEGKTYSQMDREDPNRAFYLDSLVLQSSLNQAYASIQLSLLVIGVGVAFAGLGSGALVFGLPLINKSKALA